MTEREKALEACAAEISVPVATRDGGIDYKEMYLRWRAVACERADIARAALRAKLAQDADLLDIVETAISDANDVDVTTHDYAVAVVRALREAGVTPPAQETDR